MDWRASSGIQELKNVNESIPLFLDIVGPELSVARARELLIGAGGNIEVAINHYFSNPYREVEEKTPAKIVPPKPATPSDVFGRGEFKAPAKAESTNSATYLPNNFVKSNRIDSEDESEGNIKFDPEAPPLKLPEPPAIPNDSDSDSEFDRQLAEAMKRSLNDNGIEIISARKRKADELDLSSDDESPFKRARLEDTGGTDDSRFRDKPPAWNDTYTINEPRYGRASNNEIIDMFHNYRSGEYRLAPVPSGLKVVLRDYQRMSLAWMIDREMFGWRFPTLQGYASSLVRGGFLCEEMGLGKTCEILALILSRRTHPNVPRQPTLIVCTLTLISQWRIEIQKLVEEGELKVAYWHGSDRLKNFQRQFGKYYTKFTKTSSLNEIRNFFDDVDIVLTSYTITQDRYLFNQRWLRVVLDESQMLKNPSSTQTSKAVALQATHRWCVSGTPVSGNIADLRGPLRFLHASPLTEDAFWKSHILKNSISALGVNYLQELLRIGFMRHTKDQRINGKPIVYFPSKTTRTILIKLSEEEQRNYNRLEANVLAEVRSIVRSAGAYINSRYTMLIQQLSQLREFCSLPTNQGIVRRRDQYVTKASLGYLDKTPSRGTANLNSLLAPQAPSMPVNNLAPAVNKELEDLITKTRNAIIAVGRYDEDCSICVDTPTVPVATITCLHIFCKGCINNWINFKESPKCPNCNGPIKEADLVEVPRPPPVVVHDEIEDEKGEVDELNDPMDAEEADLERAIRASLNDIDNDRPVFKSKNPMERLGEGGLVEGASMAYPSKVKRLIDDIKHLRSVSEGSKVVVFSQWLDTLISVGNRLSQENIPYASLDGSMSEKERSSALEKFNNDPSCAAFLLSIRVGAVGISLTAAHHIFLMDHCLNPATEKQAVNRCHRLGQESPVTVVKYIIERSMEHKLHLLRNDPDKLEIVENDVDDLEESDEGDDEAEVPKPREVVHAVDVPVLLKLFNIVNEGI